MKESIKECQYCYKKLNFDQAYIVFSRKLNRTVHLCPNCLLNWNTKEIKEVVVPESILRATGKNTTDVKKDLEDWNFSLLNV